MEEHISKVNDVKAEFRVVKYFRRFNGVITVKKKIKKKVKARRARNASTGDPRAILK